MHKMKVLSKVMLMIITVIIICITIPLIIKDDKTTMNDVMNRIPNNTVKVDNCTLYRLSSYGLKVTYIHEKVPTFLMITEEAALSKLRDYIIQSNTTLIIYNKKSIPLIINATNADYYIHNEYKSTDLLEFIHCLHAT